MIHSTSAADVAIEHGEAACRDSLVPSGTSSTAHIAAHFDL